MEREKVTETLREKLGEGFQVRIEGEIHVLVRHRGLMTSLAKIFQTYDRKERIHVEPQASVNNSRGLEALDLRSYYRRVGEEMKQMGFGQVYLW